MKDRIFYAICLGFLAGVLLRSFVFVNSYITILCAIASLFSVITFKYFTKLKWGIIFSVLCFAFFVGILRFSSIDKPNPSVFESKVGEKVELSGNVVDEPDERENNQKITIDTGFQENKTKILVTIPPGEDVEYGDDVTISGKLEKPENFITDAGKEFDYVNYLKKDGILYLINYGEVDVLSRGNGSKIKSALFYVKEKFMEAIDFSIPSPESLLMGGLILGEKSSFDKSLRQSFVDTGTIHIVALSGYNVTIVAEWIMKLFKFLPQIFSVWAGIVAILLFVLMTGGSSTALRAGIMATLALIARATGRNYDVARALVIALVLMVLINPMLLVYDVSFQLSFIATIAVIFVSPRVEKYFLWITERGQLRDIVSVTFAAYIFVLPFILYKMGNLSLVALPANFLILPFIPFTMGLGFITGIAGLVSPLVGIPLGYISYLFLHYELGVIGFLSRVPFASVSIPDFPLWITLCIYGLFSYWLFWRNLKSYLNTSFW